MGVTINECWREKDKQRNRWNEKEKEKKNKRVKYEIKITDVKERVTKKNEINEERQKKYARKERRSSW